MSTIPLSTRLSDIKRMLRLLRNAVYTLFGIASLILIVYVIGAFAVKWLTGRDFSEAFIFPETVVLSFNQALGIAGGVALIVFCLLVIGNKIEEMDTKLASIAISLEHLEPLVKEGRVLWEVEAELEADRYNFDFDKTNEKKSE